MERERAADDMDELLRMQAQFESGSSQGDNRPAAKVTRISRRPAAAAAAAAPAAPPPPSAHACPAHGPACQGHHAAADSTGADPQGQMGDLLAAMQTAMRGIVGEVQEREVAPPAPPVAAPAPTSGASFPEASHRRLSRFALGRQRQRDAPAGAAAVAAPPPAVPAGLDEESAIDVENRQLLAAMSAEQVEDARQEALERLSPTAVEFLRRRGARKAAAAASAPAAATAGATLPAGSASGAASEVAGSGMAGRRSQQRPQRAAQQAAPPGAGASQARLAARLRFGIDGAVVGLRPAAAGDADVSPADVAERDPIRQGEASSSEGYTVHEACLLARSSLPQQRVLALRLLAEVLAASRPRPGSVPNGGPVPLPAELSAQLQQEGQAPAAPLQWVALWHHALHSADITLLLRRSLDDSHPAVAGAAAEALAALVGAAGLGGAAEEAAAEAADACPLTGWPAPPLRHMQRPSAGGAWVAAPTPTELARQRDAGGEERAGEEEAFDPQQIAKVDPLSGLLHMQLLERTAYLISTARAAPALDPLLSILVKLCQAGKDVADEILETPGMAQALKAVLDAPPPRTPAAGPAAAPTDAAAAAFYAARPKALRLLRQLASASKATARRLQETGLVRIALEQLLRAAVAPPAGAGAAAATAVDTTPRQRGMLCEALRLWRAFAQHSFFLLLLDDAYASLCAFLSPPALAPEAVAGGALPAEALQQWVVCREAYSLAAQLCWHAARSKPHEAQLTPQCAAALAAGALDWMSGLPLQQLLAACAADCAGAGSTAAGAAAAVPGLARISPYPALDAAAGDGANHRSVLLSTLAAALHCVGSYWGVQLWHTAAEKAAAAQTLCTFGLLPAGERAADAPPALQAVRTLLAQLVAADTLWQPHSSVAGGAAAAELALALARLAATFLPAPAAAAAAASLLEPLHTTHAARRFLQAAHAADATLSQPWDAARQLQLLPLARAAVAGLQAAAMAPLGQLPEESRHVTALALLQLLPAGDEAGALQLLALVLHPDQMRRTRAATLIALAQPAARGKVAELAAWMASCDGQNSSAAPPEPPLPERLSQVLLPGYAAAWLGLVPEQGQQQSRQEEVAAAALLRPPARVALLRPQGSRLPLPHDWDLQEAPVPPAECGVAANAATAVAGALLVALGWEEQQQALHVDTAGAAAAAQAAEQKLRSAVLLVFGEQQQQQHHAGVVPGKLAAVAEEEEEDAEAREHPFVRWCLSVVMQRWATAAAAAQAAAGGAPADGASAGSWQQQEALQLAQRFAAVSYGDPLFGAATALLLRHTVPANTQLEVLSSLADEQALHLLPPLRLLPGPAAAYLDALSAGGQSASFGRACFGATAAAAPAQPSGSSRRQERDFYVKLLTEGQLERCLAAADSSGDAGGGDAGEGDGACCARCSAAVPLVVHRLACACFPDATSSGAEAATAQQALLCGILQRCAGGGPNLQRLLGWLLRWDTSAGQPSDAISSDRLKAIDSACAAGGLDAAALLPAALEA